MKRLKTVYICDNCGAIELPELYLSCGDIWKDIPSDWMTVFGNKHLCPTCSKIYSKFKQEVEKENENK